MDIYLDCVSNVMPELLSEDIANSLQLNPARRFEAAMRDLRQCPKALASFKPKDGGDSCRNFSYCNWDHHFQEEVNSALRKIPLEQLTNNSYSTIKLISLAWSVLLAYNVDRKRNLCLLGIIIEKLLCEKPTDESTVFFQKLWRYVEDLDLPMSLCESIVTVMPLYLEELICVLMQNSLSEPIENVKCAVKDVILRKDAQNWLRMCSKSPKIFQISASIVNMLLLHSGQKVTNCLIFIDVFLSTLRKYIVKNCEKVTFVSLYPVHLQSLVNLLTVNPKYLTEADRVQVVKNVSEKLLEGLVTDRAMYLCLLSHFPKWIKYLPNNFLTLPIIVL